MRSLLRAASTLVPLRVLCFRLLPPLSLLASPTAVPIAGPSSLAHALRHSGPATLIVPHPIEAASVHLPTWCALIQPREQELVLHVQRARAEEAPCSLKRGKHSITEEVAKVCGRERGHLNEHWGAQVPRTRGHTTAPHGEPMIDRNGGGAAKVAARPDVDTRFKGAHRTKFVWRSKVIPTDLTSIEADMSKKARPLFLVALLPVACRIDAHEICTTVRVTACVPASKASV